MAECSDAKRRSQTLWHWVRTGCRIRRVVIIARRNRDNTSESRCANNCEWDGTTKTGCSNARYRSEGRSRRNDWCSRCRHNHGCCRNNRCCRYRSGYGCRRTGRSPERLRFADCERLTAVFDEQSTTTTKLLFAAIGGTAFVGLAKGTCVEACVLFATLCSTGRVDVGWIDRRQLNARRTVRAEAGYGITARKSRLSACRTSKRSECQRNTGENDVSKHYTFPVVKNSRPCGPCACYI